jgi:TRAP-type C4-dicarboxylate transport system permease small subunit
MPANAFRRRVVTMNRAGSVLSQAAIVLMMLLISADIAGRSAFGVPVLGAYELSEFLMGMTVFAGIGYVQARKEHLTIDLVTSRLPRGVVARLDLVHAAAGVLLYGLIAWQGLLGAWYAYEIGDRTAGLVRIPYWPAKAIVPLGAALLTLQIVADAISRPRGSDTD